MPACDRGRGIGGRSPSVRDCDLDGAGAWFGIVADRGLDGTSAVSSDAFFAFALCSFFNLSFACIARSFSCRISSSSSSSRSIVSSAPSSSGRSWDNAFRAGVLALLVGEGDGEVLLTIRRYRSRPEGVLNKASCGDLGGHCGSGPVPAPAPAMM